MEARSRADADEPLVVDILAAFVDNLRRSGVEVGVAEHLDAARVIAEIGFADKATLRHALGATLAKSRAAWTTFESVFDWFFSVTGHTSTPSEHDRAAFRRRAEAVVATGDVRRLRSVAREAVQLLGGMEDGPVGVNYHLHRTLRQLDHATLVDRAVAGADAGHARPLTPLERRLIRRTATRVAEQLREEIEVEIRRRVGFRDIERAPAGLLPTELEFRRASGSELDQIRRAVQPLARRLAARLALRRRRRRGRVDFRATIRRSLAYGGVPVDPVVRDRHPVMPELIVLADVSRSVADFSRFTLQLVHALSTEFSRVRSFVFVDAVEEVTEVLRDWAGVAQAVQALGTTVGITRFDGHSDYGRALQEFWARWGKEVTPRTTILVLGDGRNNQHAPQAWALGELRRRARRVYWLNPEPVGSWDTGDSIVGEYAPYTDEVVECRSLAHLERFVERCC